MINTNSDDITFIYHLFCIIYIKLISFIIPKNSNNSWARLPFTQKIAFLNGKFYHISFYWGSFVNFVFFIIDVTILKLKVRILRYF